MLNGVVRLVDLVVDESRQSEAPSSDRPFAFAGSATDLLGLDERHELITEECSQVPGALSVFEMGGQALPRFGGCEEGSLLGTSRSKGDLLIKLVRIGLPGDMIAKEQELFLVLDDGKPFLSFQALDRISFRKHTCPNRHQHLAVCAAVKQTRTDCSFAFRVCLGSQHDSLLILHVIWGEKCLASDEGHSAVRHTLHRDDEQDQAIFSDAVFD